MNGHSFCVSKNKSMLIIYNNGCGDIGVRFKSGTVSSDSELWVPIYIFVYITATCVDIFQYLTKTGTTSSDYVLCKLFDIVNHNTYLKILSGGTPLAIV